MAVSDALAAFAAVKSALLDKHVDPADVDAATTALNTIADTDVGTSLNAIIETAASTLSTDLVPDADDGGHVESTLFTALQSSILASALPDEPSATDAEVTADELSTALGLMRTEPDTATPDDSTDDTLATDDFSAFLNNVAMLEDIIDMTDGDTSTADVNDVASTALDALVTALEATVVDTADASASGSLAAAIIAAEGFRSSTLAYNSFAAMAALLAALDGLEIGELDVTVKVARDALIAAYENREGLANDAESEVSTSYQEIIGTGVGHHAHALNAAFLVVDAALSISGIDENLAIKIRAALATQAPYQQQLQAKITRIEATVRGVTVSAGDKVKLEVIIFGRQDLKDNKLAFGPDGTEGTSDDVTFDWGDAADDTGYSITYTAPSTSGTYTVRASLDPNECFHAEPEVQMDKCSATFEVMVRRTTSDRAPSNPPANPPGEIPGILSDGEGNQYEVFTPVEGGSFNGEGYSITAPAGAVPNGEYIGIRVSDQGSASNAGMTHQRYTLGGNMYEVSAVDASSSVIADYQLSSTATVCLPLPDQLRTNISDLAIVAINADGSLTILSASVRLGPSGISVCGNLSAIPASLAVGSEGAPRGFPTVTPEPTPEVPDTGGTAPSRNAGLWALLLGIAAFAFSSVVLINRRRRTDRPI